jgi:hypothetical protein
MDYNLDTWRKPNAIRHERDFRHWGIRIVQQRNLPTNRAEITLNSRIRSSDSLIHEHRNRDSRKDTDDDDHHQNLYKCEPMFGAQRCLHRLHAFWFSSKML